MGSQAYRRPHGGHIDRTKPLKFYFNGKKFIGFVGDTLASALLANGVHLIGRSFKYHRPRGIFAAGIEEPNGLIQLENGPKTEPNLQSTRVELYDSLNAKSQNCWPSVNFDINSINSIFHKIIPAGFYYKTFMWPKKLWMVYEHMIRKAAGMGIAPNDEDPDSYEHRYSHCDILIVGGGPSGLAAALYAGSTGARVILADANPHLGGYLCSENKIVDGQDSLTWIKKSETTLASMPNVNILYRTIGSAYYDHNMVLLNEHLNTPSEHQPRQRLWHVRAKEVILATGSLERPIVFPNNDRPGVMLMSAALTYAKVFGVRAGDHAVIFTNNSSVYPAVSELISCGITVKAVVDVRSSIPDHCLRIAKESKVKIFSGHVVYNVNGHSKVSSVEISSFNSNNQSLSGIPRTLKCDLLCISGGWTPSVHLFSQSQGKLSYDNEITAFVPTQSIHPQQSVGACNGTFHLADCIREGADAANQAAKNVLNKVENPIIPSCSDDWPLDIMALWSVPFGKREHGKKFVDFQNDVTAEDIALAHRENYISVEHLKRYTTLGMGTDQGRISNVNGLAIMAQIRGLDIPSIGTTTFRPPFSPISMGAIAGVEKDEHFIPIRRSSMHDIHTTKGADFIRAGQWLRPQHYPKQGESIEDTISREALHVRKVVGAVDVSTLGKIDLQGKDAAEFLNRLYINSFKKLEVGKCRYGVMLREDGMVFDDGTVTRIGEDHFLITTTTVKAGPVLQHMEYLAQVEWPELNIHMLSVSEEWAGIAIAGPNSRTVLSSIIDDIDLSNDACPFMAYREGTILDVPTRLFRISFSGELGYEINIPANYGADIWNHIISTGEEFNIKPYGTEAMGVLRIEKGHVVGGEINGRTTASDLGFGAMMSPLKDFIGKRASSRPGLETENRPQLVGITPLNKKTNIPRAGRITSTSTKTHPSKIEGEITSNCFSPNLGYTIGLALILHGRNRIGETVFAASPLTGQTVPVEICEPVFIDPKGEMLRG